MQEESRAKILGAALELFAEKGFEHTSMSAIARRAGVSQGLTYNYFAGKDDLLLAIFEKGWADVQASFRVPHSADGGAASLYDYIENACRLTLRHKDFWRLANAVRAQPSALERIRVRVEEFERVILGRLELYCAASPCRADNHDSGGSPMEIRAEARLLFALIDGVCNHLVRQPETYPLDDVLAILKPLYEDRTLP
jgi:AcrR family transcriptional regulator